MTTIKQQGGKYIEEFCEEIDLDLEIAREERAIAIHQQRLAQLKNNKK